MLIEFELNKKKVQADVPAYTPLSDVLRDEFGLNGLRNACGKGYCGLCSVVMDDHLVYSCLIPAFQARDKKLLTIEGYSKTDDFEDVVEGFKAEGVHLCDYCAPARALCTGIMLRSFPRPDENQLRQIITTVNCSCTPYETLKRGILHVARLRKRRMS